MAKMIRVGKTIHDGGWALNRFMVPCGRRACRKCPHGPYWYAQRWFGRKHAWRYVGKSLVDWVKGRGGRVGEEVQRELEREKALARGAEVVSGAGAEGSVRDEI